MKNNFTIKSFFLTQFTKFDEFELEVFMCLILSICQKLTPQFYNYLESKI
jgi:hypothetical protein